MNNPMMNMNSQMMNIDSQMMNMNSQMMNMNNPMMNTNSQTMNMNSQMMNMNNPMMNMNSQMMNMNNDIINMMNIMDNMNDNNQMMMDYFNNKMNEHLKIQYFRSIKNKFYEKIKTHKNEFDKTKHKNKIIINFCNELKKEIYLDLNETMKNIYKHILYSLGLWNNFKNFKIYERKNKNQTTENIIKNPFTQKLFVGRSNLFIDLKYKELRDGDEIFLDLNENFIKDYALLDYISLIFINKGKFFRDRSF